MLMSDSLRTKTFSWCCVGEDVEAVAEKLENQTAATQAMREQLEAQSAELAAARASKNELAAEVAALRAGKEAVTHALSRQQSVESAGVGAGSGLGSGSGSGIKRTTGSGRLARVSLSLTPECLQLHLRLHAAVRKS